MAYVNVWIISSVNKWLKYNEIRTQSQFKHCYPVPPSKEAKYVRKCGQGQVKFVPLLLVIEGFSLEQCAAVQMTFEAASRREYFYRCLSAP